MTDGRRSGQALRSWVSALGLWLLPVRIGWALVWRLVGLMWLLASLLGLLVLMEVPFYVAGAAGLAGLVALVGWTGGEVAAASRPPTAPGWRGRGPVLVTPNRRSAGMFLLAVLALALVCRVGGIGVELALAGLITGFEVMDFLGAVAGLEDSLPWVGLELAFAWAISWGGRNLAWVAMGVAVMFAAWCGGALRGARELPGRSFVLLTIMVVMANGLVAVAPDPADAGAGGRFASHLLVSSSGVAIGLLGVWCKRRRSLGISLAFHWLLFVWISLALTAGSGRVSSEDARRVLRTGEAAAIWAEEGPR